MSSSPQPTTFKVSKTQQRIEELKRSVSTSETPGASDVARETPKPSSEPEDAPPAPKRSGGGAVPGTTNGPPGAGGAVGGAGDSTNAKPNLHTDSFRRLVWKDPAIRVTAVGSVCNLALSGLKGVIGFASGSTALLADAVHSLSDLLSDGVTYAVTK